MTNGISTLSRRVIPVVAVLALAGCSDLDVFGLFEDDVPPPQTAADADVRARADAEAASAENSGTPSLTSVPSRPPRPSATVRERVVEGLVADRNNARYTDEAIRLQGSTRPASAPESAQARDVAPDPVPAPSEIAISTPPPAPRPAIPPAPQTSASAGTSSSSYSTPTVAYTTPRPAPQPAAAAPAPRPSVPPAPSTAYTPQTAYAAPVPSSTPSVVVDTSVLGGGGYQPVSSQISREAQVATIQFGHSSSRLGARDRQVISAVASAYRNAGGQILVVGHASSRTGQMPKDRHEVANFNVSFARANAVAQALIASGISPDRVTVEAVSDDQPMYSESMPTGEAGNRRAEIFVFQ